MFEYKITFGEFRRIYGKLYDSEHIYLKKLFKLKDIFPFLYRRIIPNAITVLNKAETGILRNR